VEKEQARRPTFKPKPSLPLDTVDLVSDDVSSIHFDESVTSPPSYLHRSQSVSARSPLKELLPPTSPIRASKSFQFIKSDSFLDQTETDEKSQAALSNATPATDNTTQPPPALTYLVYLSLICSKEAVAVKGPAMVKESLQNHVLSTLEAQPAWRSASSSVPVDLDDGSFVVEDENVGVIDDMALRDLSKGNLNGAIDVLSTLLLSQRAKHHESNVKELYSQLSVLYLLNNNPHKAMHCTRRGKKGVLGFMDMGMVHLASSSPQQALSCWRQALQLQCKLGGYHHSYIPLVLNNIACIHYLEKKGEAALVLLEESLALQREHHAADIHGLRHMATCLLNLGMVNEQIQNYEKAISLVEQGFMVMESVVPQENDFLVACRNALQRLTLLSGRDESPNMTRTQTLTTMPVFGHSDGIPMRRGTHPIDTIRMGSLTVESTLERRVHNAVVASMSSEGHKSLASVPFDLDGELVHDAELHLGGIHAQVLKHVSRDEVDEALELLRSTCKSHKVKYGNAHHLVGTALHNIAMVNMYARRYKDALWYFQEAVSVRVAALGTDHPDVSVRT
jgi:tetratricopeptide (TPR) repeat protein